MKEDLFEISKKNRQRAFEVMKELRIIETWEKFGVTANLIGSVSMGLIMKNKDIDFHVYSDNFSIADSFGAMAEFAKIEGVKNIAYGNLLDTKEACLEWHMTYLDNRNELWKIDMIHILKGSLYEGKMEKVAKRISEILTPELKMKILSIKNEIPSNENVMGIEVYMAVIRDNINNYKEFAEWKKSRNNEPIIDWIP